MDHFRQLWQSQQSRLLLLVIAYKLVCFGIVIGAIHVFPSFNYGEYSRDIHWPREGEPILATYFATWDGAHYLFLSEEGYHKDSPSCAFYPLWPYLIRTLSYLTLKNHFIAGILLANILSVVGILFFHRFVSLYHDVETANASVILLLAFPGAIFFSFIYTESLFFVLVILLFFALFREKYVWMAVIGFFLPLTKAVGLFCVFPIVCHLFLKRKPLSAYLACFGPVAGYLCYLVFMYSATGNPFEGFNAQQYYPNQPSISKIFDISAFLDALASPVHLHGMLDSALDRGFFLLLVGCLYPIFRLSKPYSVYAFLVGVIPAMSSWFLSYSRHIMMCFPLFILLGYHLKDRKECLWYLALVMGTLQIWFLLRHINFMWAG